MYLYRKKIFTGIVIPSNWERNGEITSYNLLTYEDDEYELIYKWSNEKMKPFARKRVVLTGTSIEEKERKILIVGKVNLA